MKKLLLATAVGLTLFGSTAAAEMVDGVGYGKDFETALSAAKVNATDKFNGSWVISDKRIHDGVYTEEKAEMSGGRILSYEIKSWDGEKLVIEADVVKQDNTVISNTTKFDHEMKKNLDDMLKHQEKVNKAYDKLGNYTDALKVEMNDMKMIPQGDKVMVHMNVNIVWNPKWVSDSKSLAMTIGEEGETTYGIHNKIVGSITNMAITNGHGVLGAIVGTTFWKEEKRKSTGMMCYGSKPRSVASECYDTGKTLYFPSTLRIEMWGMEGNDKVFRTVHSVENNKLYENIPAGTTKQHHSFRTLDMKYLQPTLAIYEEMVYNVKYGFVIDAKRLKQVDEFKFVIK
jgi:hypothetical protein